jgi:4'-phosphopantetheinyl transferase EntD
MPPAEAAWAELHPLERAVTERAGEKRRREHAAGRLLARTLVAELGVEGAQPLLADDDRVPRWPAAVVGSISHCATLCVVAVAPASSVRGVGIDVEPALPLPPGVGPLVLFAPDHEALASAADHRRPLFERVVFSAKEAVYKAIFPITRRSLDFPAMAVRVFEDGSLDATLRLDVPFFAAGTRFEGRWTEHAGHVVTAFVLLG